MILLDYSSISYDNIIVHGGINSKSSPNINIINSNKVSILNKNHFEEFIQSISNLNYSGGTSRARYVQIRGLGELSQFSGEGPPHFYIGYVIDDIDFSGLGVSLLSDIKQIEVFKGPQSSIYGPNSMGGIINVVSNDPTDKEEFLFKSSFSNYNGIIINTIFSYPLSNKLNTRFTYHTLKSDGYIKNNYIKSNTTNALNEELLRIKLIYNISNYLKLKLTSYFVNIKNGYDMWTPDNNGYITYTDFGGKDYQETDAYSLKLTYYFKDFLATLISTYSSTNSFYSYDADWANDNYWLDEPYNFNSSTEGYAWSFTDLTNRQKTTKTQELRISKYFYSSIATAGIYISNIKEKDQRNGWIFSGIADNINSKFDIDNYAIYFQLQHFFNNKLNLTMTSRYDYTITLQNLNYSLYNWYTNINEITILPALETIDKNLIGGNIKLNYKANQNFNLLLSLGRGYKTSGINQSPNFPDNKFYHTEYSNNIDIGFLYKKKNLEIDFTAFYNYRKNPQLRIFTQFDLQNPTSFDYATFNTQYGVNKGFETSIRIKQDSTILVYLELGVLDTYISTFTFLENQYGDRETSHSPKYSGTLGTNVNLSNFFDNIYLNIESNFLGEFYFDDQNNHKSKPYNIFNASIGYKKDNIEINVWGKNIFNTNYAIRGYTFALDPTYEVRDWKSYGNKRTIGFSIILKV